MRRKLPARLSQLTVDTAPDSRQSLATNFVDSFMPDGPPPPRPLVIRSFAPLTHN